MIFKDIVPDPKLLMGAKAVFGPFRSHLLCFGARGTLDQNSYFSKPRKAAEKSIEAPFILAIGGGQRVRDNLGGKVLNIGKASFDYGLTADLAEPEEAKRLQQWPVVLVMNDVWEFDGYPHLIDDMKMPDKRVLEAAMDGIVRHDDRIKRLWEALADWPMILQNLPLPSNFVPSSKPTLFSKTKSTRSVDITSEEGQRVWKLQCAVERNRKVTDAAKLLNIAEHGISTCESCNFADADTGMYDAHHPTPLAAGVRTTLPEHLVILCPTCHRRAHRKDRLNPYTLGELRAWVLAGRK